MLTQITVVIVWVLALACTYAQEDGVVWNVTMTQPRSNRVILNAVSGRASKGKLHAIMGPSGSGKSSLLNVLAGVVPKKSLALEGFVHLDSEVAPVYIQQEDLLFAQLTVTETLDTSAALRSDDSASQRAGVVDRIINNLGLKKSRATPVGDAKTRGLSGGEKKRLSIGNELIGSDSGGCVVFADEPTSGLDSFQAERVMQILKALADQGNTIIASIHQPRASIFALFDEITLMSEGRVMYTGDARKMAAHFSALGHPCPNQVSPAEYYLDLVSVDYSSPQAETESKTRIARLAESMHKQLSTSALDQQALFDKYGASGSFSFDKAATANAKPRRGLLASIQRASSKFALLYKRAWRTVSRDKALNIARFCSSVFSALLFGAIYYKLGDGASTVPDRLGLLQVAAVNTAMTSLIKATTSFVSEKLIVQRERRSGAYAVTPYFISKLLAEAPISAVFPCLAGGIIYKLCGLNKAPGRFARFLGILVVESFASSAFGMAVGSLASSVDSAIATAPALMVIFIVFGGLYVVNTPKYLAWVPNVSLIRWAYEALCVNEFSGLALRPEAKVGPKAVTKGEQVLDSMGYGQSTVKGALLAQGAIIAANYLFTLISLIRQKPSFEKVKPPPGIRSSRSASNHDIHSAPVKPTVPRF